MIDVKVIGCQNICPMERSRAADPFWWEKA